MKLNRLAWVLLAVALVAIPSAYALVFRRDVNRFTSTQNAGSCTLDGASPSVCTATVVASSQCLCSNVGATAAIAANGCATGLSGTTLTVTSANGATNVVRYHCF